MTRANGHVPRLPGRAVLRRYRPGGQSCSDLIHEGAQVGLDARIVLKQVHQPRHPLRLQRRSDGFSTLARHLDKLFTRPDKALFGKLRLSVITLAKQQGKPMTCDPGWINRRYSHRGLPTQPR
jgi:hypothetical protein